VTATQTIAPSVSTQRLPTVAINLAGQQASRDGPALGHVIGMGNIMQPPRQQFVAGIAGDAA
jgi:hypothetical protein